MRSIKLLLILVLVINASVSNVYAYGYWLDDSPIPKIVVKFKDPPIILDDVNLKKFHTDIDIGNVVEFNTYQIRSIQGFLRGTYIPNLDKFLKKYTLPEHYDAVIKEEWFFEQTNRKPNYYNTIGMKNLDLIEAINWLYSNNYLHMQESLVREHNQMKIIEHNNLLLNEQDGSKKTIDKKDFVMQLVKGTKGVIESRPILLKDEFRNINDKGEATIWRPARHPVPIEETRYKDLLSSYNFEITKIRLNIRALGAHWLYINPNVYELYLDDALKHGVISIEDFKQGTPFLTEREEKPMWDNNLHPIRLPETNGKTDISKVFGSSYNHDEETGFQYNKDFRFFNQEELSYLEAVEMIYKALITYEEERLNEREVKTIASMYSVNYGQINEEQKKAVTYLIAKGIIDGDNAAKYLSPSPITVEDALILLYRVTNKEGRLDFKTNFTPLDEEMLDKNYVQSEVSVFEFGDVPSLEFQEDNYSYYIVESNNLRHYHQMQSYIERGYQLSNTPGKRIKNQMYEPVRMFIPATHIQIPGVQASSYYMTHPSILRDPTVPKETLGYVIAKYVIPSKQLPYNLGYTITPDLKNADAPNWVNIPTEENGGLFYVPDSDFRGKREATFNRIDLETDENYKRIIENTEKKLFGEPIEIKDEQVSFLNTLTDLFFGKAVYAEDLGALQPEFSTAQVSIVVNNTSLNHLMFNGQHLFQDGQLNKEVVTSRANVRNLEIEKNGDKTILKFTVVKIDGYNMSQLRENIMLQLGLDPEGAVANYDLASYTHVENGQTMISRNELNRFGIEVTKDNPDILYHAKTDIYGYLNPDKSYVLINNTLKQYPQNTLMIETSGGDFYYNIDVVMSMLNDDDYFVFNDSGKMQVVKKLNNLSMITVEDNKGRKEADTYLRVVNNNNYLNITSTSGRSNTFFSVLNKENNKRYIYGFRPFYNRVMAYDERITPTVADLRYDLIGRSLTLIEKENILINNAISRMEFKLPKTERFLYTKNAMTVTSISDVTLTADKQAEELFSYLTELVKHISVTDVTSISHDKKHTHSEDLNFKISDLLSFQEFSNSAIAREAERIIKSDSTSEAVLFLYLLNSFEYDKVKAGDLFHSTLIKKYNEKFGEKIKITNKEELLGLKRKYREGYTNYGSIRVFTFLETKNTNDQARITTDGEFRFEENDTIYVRVVGDESKSKYQDRILGTNYRLLRENGVPKIQFEDKALYYGVAENLIPIETLPEGSIVNIGSTEYQLVNNHVFSKQGSNEYLLLKLINPKLKNPINALTSIENQNYQDSLINQKIPRVLHKAIYDKSWQQNMFLTANELIGLQKELNFYYPNGPKTINTYIIRENNRKVVPVTLIENDKMYRPLIVSDSLDYSPSKADKQLAYNTLLVKFGHLAVYPVVGEDKKTTYFVANSARDRDYLTMSVPMSNLVNRLVYIVKTDRVKAEKVTVADIPDGSIISLNGSDYSLVKTGLKDGEYINYITNAPMQNSISKKDLENKDSLLIRNYGIMSSIKVGAYLNQHSLYKYISNVDLNIATEEAIKKVQGNLKTTPKEKHSMIERMGLKSQEIVVPNKQINPTDFKMTTLSGNSDFQVTGLSQSVDIKNDEQGYKYFLSLYLNPQIVVVPKETGTYEIIGFENENEIGKGAFNSIVDRFKGIFGEHLSIIPDVDNIDGTLLGFNLDDFNLERLLNMFSISNLNKILDNLILEMESALPVLGIYYVYVILALLVLGRTTGGGFYKWIFNPVRFATFNRLDSETASLSHMITHGFIAIILLSMMYEGYLRNFLLKFVETSSVFIDFFF